MEQLSRVKKYEQLRNTIENDGVSVTGAEAAIKEITKTQEDVKTYSPSHEKESVFNEEIKKDELDSTFKNEYLDSFIQEVRDYNIKKGVREYEDTKLDILQQLSSKNREKRANYVETINAEPEAARNVSEETMEISKQVFDLLNEESKDADNNIEVRDEVSEDAVMFAKAEPKVESMEEVKSEPAFKANLNVAKTAVESDANRMSSELEARIASLESQLVETTQQLKVQSSFNDADDFEDFSKRELVEETMKLKVQMNEYKDELEDLNTGIDSNNRLLNIIITILIVALLAVIGVVVYWLIAGGIL